MVPPAFAACAALACAVTGAHVSLTAFRSSNFSRFLQMTTPVLTNGVGKVITTLYKPLREQPGEVDFAAYPAISH